MSCKDTSSEPKSSGQASSATHDANKTGNIAGDLPESTSQETGRGSWKAKNKKKYKKKRVPTSVSLSQAEAAQVHGQAFTDRGDGSETAPKPSNALYSTAHLASCLDAAEAPNQGPCHPAATSSVVTGEQQQQQQAVPHRSDVSPTRVGNVTGPVKDIKRSGKHGEESHDNASGSRPAQNNTRQEYRANAGGSLRFTKKRRGKQYACEMQSVESAGNSSTGTPILSATSSFELVPSNISDPSALRNGPQQQSTAAGDPVVTPLRLNPLAEAFVSPRSEAKGKGVDSGEAATPTGSPLKPAKEESPALMETEKTIKAEKNPGTTSPKKEPGEQMNVKDDGDVRKFVLIDEHNPALEATREAEASPKAKEC